MPSRKTDPADLPDVNVLVAMVHTAHVHHAQALAWFASTARYCTTPATEAGFVRLALNHAIMGAPVTREQALASLISIKGDPRAEFLADDATFTSSAIRLDGLVGHRQVTDLHLVNLAASHGARLVTFDKRIAGTLSGADGDYVHNIG